MMAAAAAAAVVVVAAAAVAGVEYVLVFDMAKTVGIGCGYMMMNIDDCSCSCMVDCNSYRHQAVVVAEPVVVAIVDAFDW